MVVQIALPAYACQATGACIYDKEKQALLSKLANLFQQSRTCAGERMRDSSAQKRKGCVGLTNGLHAYVAHVQTSDRNGHLR